MPNVRARCKLLSLDPRSRSFGGLQPIHLQRIDMPFVNVKLMDGVFSSDEKHAMAAALTDVMVKFEGSEAFREVVWVLIEELHTDGWHIGGRPFMGPKSIMETLGRSKSVFESIDGHPVTRAELQAVSPVLPYQSSRIARRASA